ncbi:MAG: molecular chaperone DnaJ [Pseudomonadota bacterium]|nr:molecular chaperone DnaJ [Pseudomonadota bacterium]
MAKRDFYDVLGVAHDADDAALKSAYRRLAMKYHPDRNPDDPTAEQNFKEVNEAYDVLKDGQKRAAYDRFGHDAFENGGGGGGPGFSGFGGGFADIFDEVFGEFMGGRSQRQSGRGSDLRFNMAISLEDAFNGRQREVDIPSSVVCEECNGNGAARGAGPTTCHSCQGHGKIRAQQGFFTIERTCPTCAGTGQIISDPCRACGGTGRKERTKTLSVTIPAGVEDGTRIRLAGEGEAGLRGAPAGDLYIFLEIEEHPIFHREGPDLLCQVPVSMTTAALGGQIEVPTIEGGRARLTIDAGAQSGKRFRLRQKGMSVLRSAARGDLYIEIAVETPVNLTARQRELLAAFDEEGGAGTHPKTNGFFNRVKEFWDDLGE